MANNALVFGVHLADEQNFFVTATKVRFAHFGIVRFDENRNLREARTCNWLSAVSQHVLTF